MLSNGTLRDAMTRYAMINHAMLSYATLSHDVRASLGRLLENGLRRPLFV